MTPHPIAVICAEKIDEKFMLHNVEEVALLITTHFKDVLQALDKSEHVLGTSHDTLSLCKTTMHNSNRPTIEHECEVTLDEIQDALTAITEAKKVK